MVKSRQGLQCTTSAAPCRHVICTEDFPRQQKLHAHTTSNVVPPPVGGCYWPGKVSGPTGSQKIYQLVIMLAMIATCRTSQRSLTSILSKLLLTLHSPLYRYIHFHTNQQLHHTKHILKPHTQHFTTSETTDHLTALLTIPNPTKHHNASTPCHISHSITTPPSPTNPLRHHIPPLKHIKTQQIAIMSHADADKAVKTALQTCIQLLPNMETQQTKFSKYPPAIKPSTHLSQHHPDNTHNHK